MPAPAYINPLISISRFGFDVTKGSTLAIVSTNLDTNLTKGGVSPSKHISKEEFNRMLVGMREDGVGLTDIDNPFGAMDELEAAKLHVSNLEAAYKQDRGGLHSYIHRDAILEKARAKVTEIERRYAREAALVAAKDKLRKQVRDAIAKRRGGLIG